PGVEHGDHDVVAHHDALPGATGQYEHPPVPPHWTVREEYPIYPTSSGARTGSPLPPRMSCAARRLDWATTIGAMRFAVVCAGVSPAVSTTRTSRSSASGRPSATSDSSSTSTV